jgi:hypothetical protein
VRRRGLSGHIHVPGGIDLDGEGRVGSAAAERRSKCYFSGRIELGHKRIPKAISEFGGLAALQTCLEGSRRDREIDRGGLSRHVGVAIPVDGDRQT